MSKYTIIMEYKGGTYISQVQSGSVKSALKKWAKNLDCSGVFGLSEKGKNKLITEVANEKPTALNDIDSVWCIFCSLPSGSALINIVSTYEDKST